MKKGLYIIQLIISVIGLVIFGIFTAIVGGYAVEVKANPSFIDKLIYAFDVSAYPLYTSLFFIWFIISIVIITVYMRNKG